VKTLQTSYVIDWYMISCPKSIVISCHPTNVLTILEILKHAHLTMPQAKKLDQLSMFFIKIRYHYPSNRTETPGYSHNWVSTFVLGAGR